MKNFIYILIVFLFTACSRGKVDLIFDKLPEVRMAERNAELRNLLTGNTNGWKAFLKTSLNGSGYGFYMKFNEDETVAMYSDWDNTAAVTSKNSTYSIRYLMNTSLIFDTYNYISIMQDPNPAVNGGVRADGLRSDVEFEFLGYKGVVNHDTVLLRGRRYGNYLYLIKSSAEQSTAYTTGGYLTAINNVKDFFLTKKNNYISFTVNGTEIKASIEMGLSNKTISMQAKQANGSIVASTEGFGYSADGAFFTNPLVLLGKVFIALRVKPGNIFVIVDDAGNEYPINQNPVPFIDFKDVFGSTKAYNSIYIVNATLPAGVTSGFNTVHAGLISRFANTGRTIDTLEIKLFNNNTAHVRIWYYSTSRFLADASFAYTLVGDVLTFGTYTPSVSNTNWTTRITEIGNFLNWLQSGPFKVDWVSSSVPGSPNYGGLYKVATPSDFYYGMIRKI